MACQPKAAAGMRGRTSDKQPAAPSSTPGPEAHEHPRGGGGGGGSGRLYTERVRGAPSEAGASVCTTGPRCMPREQRTLAWPGGDGSARHWQADRADTSTWDAATGWRTRE